MHTWTILIGLLACDNPCMHGQFMHPRYHRNFCILIGLLACDNPCVHGQFMHLSLCSKLLHFDWLISFEIVIAQNYKLLHRITLFCTELQSNCTALDQPVSSNFFMYNFNNWLLLFLSLIKVGLPVVSVGAVKQVLHKVLNKR